MDEHELRLWTVFAELERLGLQQYDAWASEMLLPSKRQLVDRLSTIAPNADALTGTALQQPLAKVVRESLGTNELQTLFIQGLLLERLANTTYQSLLDAKTLGPESIPVAELGVLASEDVLQRAPKRLEELLGPDDDAYDLFVSATRGVLNSFDDLGEGVDEVLAPRFEIDFADLVGDFTAELIPTCCDLGMSRRQVVIHLTGAFMGL